MSTVTRKQWEKPCTPLIIPIVPEDNIPPDDIILQQLDNIDLATTKFNNHQQNTHYPSKWRLKTHKQISLQYEKRTKKQKQNERQNNMPSFDI